MKSKRLLLTIAGVLVAAPLAGCAVTDASKKLNDLFPTTAATDAKRSPSKSTELLDTIPDASEVKELNE